METTATPAISAEEGMTILRALIDAGIDPELAKRIGESRDNALARKMVIVGKAGYPAIDERLAHRIMGDNFFGREEWASLYGVHLTSKMSRVAAKFPWSEELLDSECPFNPGKAVRETHFAFLGIDKLSGKPLSIMQWQQVHPDSGQPRFRLYGSDCWYQYQKWEFATAALEPRWYLGLVEVVPGSTSTSWDIMGNMIPEAYYLPSPIAEVTKDFLCYQKHGKCPNRDIDAATDVLVACGTRVIVGSCNNDSVHVDYWFGSASRYVGPSLFRKS